LDTWGRKHRQVNATEARRIRTSGALVGPWLRTLPGVGEERAARLVLRFGDNIVSALSDPACIDQLADALAPSKPHLGQKLAALLQARFASRRASESVALGEVEFYRKLEGVGVSDRSAARSLYRLLGSLEPWVKLVAHPYATAAVMSWRNADHIGQRLLLQREDAGNPKRHRDRLLGACDAAWRNILSRGDTASTRSDFLRELGRLGVDAARALAEGLAAHRVMASEGQLRAPGAARMEREVARELRRLTQPLPPFDWRRVVRTAEVAPHPLTDEQLAAVLDLLSRSVSILQGGAGTGKTTTVRALVDAWASRGGRVVLAALAGKAALRLSRSTGREALTLARLVHCLERRATATAQGRLIDPKEAEIDNTTLLVVDESSMVDLVTWRRVLRLMPAGARLVMVGDLAQLPPVGLGGVFHDLVDDGKRGLVAALRG